MKSLVEQQAIFYADLLKQQIRGLSHGSVRLSVEGITFDGESHTHAHVEGAKLLGLVIGGNTEAEMIFVWEAFMALKEDRQKRLYVKVDALSNSTFWRAL